MAGSAHRKGAMNEVPPLSWVRPESASSSLVSPNTSLCAGERRGTDRAQHAMHTIAPIERPAGLPGQDKQLRAWTD